MSRASVKCHGYHRSITALFLCLACCHAFVVNPSVVGRRSNAHTVWRARKKSRSNQGKKRRNPKQEAPQKKAVLPSVKSRAPPWQVLSAKDAKENVEKEKKRRKLAQQGLETNDTDTSKLKTNVSLMNDATRQLLTWKRFSPSSPTAMEYIGSYLGTKLPPRLGVPEVAFLGRSNVGKSSLLNRLSRNIDNQEAARVGKTPGATASVNLYAMLGSKQKPILGLVDLPGFGYAKLSKEVQESVQLAAERYLGKRQELALGILLVDARREPSDDDRAVLAALYDIGVPLVVVATKVDKLSGNVDASLGKIRHGLGLPDGQPLCVSSVTGQGTKQLWKIILEACEMRIEELRDEHERVGTKEDLDYETIPLDGLGNLIEQEGEDFAYDQGYDWVHSGAVMYDGDEEDYIPGEDDELEEQDDEFTDPTGASDKDAFKLKNLKKRVRGMERRGEI